MKHFALTFLLSGLCAVASGQTPSTAKKDVPQKEAPKPAAPPVAAKPEPIKPAEVKPAAAPKPEEHTTIDSESSTMDTKNSVAVFTGNVEVRSPQFHMTTDGDFEVHMKKQAKPKPGAEDKKPAADKADDKKVEAKPAPTTADAANALNAKPGAEDNGVELAIARGKMVVIEKKDAEGKMKIGKCRHATYDGKTGNITLRDWPQVQDGQNLIIATDASTRMLLTQDGHLQVFGRARTDIIGSQNQPQKGQ